MVRKRWHRKHRIIKAVLVAPVFLFLLLELLVRCTLSADLHGLANIFDWDHYNGRYPVLIPNSEGIYRGIPIMSRLDPTTIRLNNYGFRGADFQRPIEGQDRILIECYGDSMTFGIGVGETDTLPYDLQSELTSRCPKAGIEVYNLGIMGMNFVEEESLFENVGLSFQPKIVVVFLFGNDLSTSLFEIMYRKSYLMHIPSDAVTLASQVWFGHESGLPPGEKERNQFLAALSHMHSVCQERGIELIIAVLKFQEGYRHFTEQAFRLNNIQYVDLSTIFNSCPNIHLTERDSHLNSYGCRLLAERTADYIMEHNPSLNKLGAEKRPAVSAHGNVMEQSTLCQLHN